MKKLTLSLALMLSLTLGALAQYSLSLTTNERGEWSPVAVYEVGKLTNVLGTKQELRILGFAGYNSRSERTVFAGALVYSVKLAKLAATSQTVSLGFGPAIRYDGAKPNLGAFIGINFSF